MGCCLGEGSFGTVFKAGKAGIKNDCVYAIKKIKKTIYSKKCFMSEAMNLNSLDHPNIVKIYEIVQDAHNYYIIMEYIKGECLSKKLANSINLTELK